MKKLQIINGPNLNLLGKREPEIYGNQSFDQFLDEIKQNFPDASIGYFQSNVEGEIINELQRVGFEVDGILLNAGGYTHTSVAIADAIAAIESPVIEIHISQPAAREPYRKQSLIAEKCIASISGLGLKSYLYGIQYFIES